MIAVEQIDHEPFTLVDAARERIPLRLLPVPQRPLPEADVAGGDVQIAGQAPKVAHRGTLHGIEAGPRFEPPAMKHGDAVAGVAQRERQIDGVADHLSGAATAGYARSDRR